MFQGLLSKLFRAHQPDDVDLLDAYGAVLENAELHEPLSKLPAPKTRLKAAILNRARVATSDEKRGLLVAYLALSSFQDLTAPSASMADMKATLNKNGDDFIQAMMKLGPNIENMGRLNTICTQERRVLAEEWEQAEIANILAANKLVQGRS